MLYEKLLTLHPDLRGGKYLLDLSIIIQDDGEGPYIAKWEHPSIPKPTDAELATVVVPEDFGY